MPYEARPIADGAVVAGPVVGGFVVKMARAHKDAAAGRSTSGGAGKEIIDLGDSHRLELGAMVGKGAYAKVYRAVLASRVSGVRRPVAVKLYSAVSSDEIDQIIAIIAKSTRRMACIEHPNIARVYECGVWRGQPFVVSELVDGVTLGALQDAYQAKHRRLPTDLALYIATEVAEALAGARTARDLDGVQLGVVHHSVCAREVLLSWRGEVKLTDFEASTARAATSSVRSLRNVATRATAMAPEVAQGALGDARSDVFSLGVLLRELFIGPRFPSGLSNADAIRLAREGYVQPMTFQPHLPQGLVDIMLRAIEVDPELRYPNPCAMAFDLRRIAFAMGVGDGRYFLKSALHREWSEYAEEITSERDLPTNEDDESEYEPYEGDVVELAAKRRDKQNRPRR
jgi:eukaryotic-like serine/threonine-protein kinase